MVHRGGKSLLGREVPAPGDLDRETEGCQDPAHIGDHIMAPRSSPACSLRCVGAEGRVRGRDASPGAGVREMGARAGDGTGGRGGEVAFPAEAQCVLTGEGDVN